MKNKIAFSIYGIPSEVSNSLKGINDLSYSYKPVEMAFDTALDSARTIELFLEFSSAVGINIFAAWLYDRIKNNDKKDTIIGGNEISGNNITVVQIVNIIESELNNKAKE